MGLFLSRIYSLISSKVPCRILMIGLDGAGKTTILYKLKLGEVVTTIPTIEISMCSMHLCKFFNTKFPNFFCDPYEISHGILGAICPLVGNRWSETEKAAVREVTKIWDLESDHLTRLPWELENKGCLQSYKNKARFNVETVEYKNISFTVWDIGGQERLRPLWRHYYQNTAGIIYVVDTNDPDRLEESREELQGVIQHEELLECPLLILANKQDLPQASPPSVITDAFSLRNYARPWSVQPACATSGTGIYKGLDWLANEVTKKSK